jgi:hypothetical protein
MRHDRTRLKWFKNKDGMIISEPMLAGCEVMRVTINPEQMNYTIRDVKGRYCFAAGKAENMRNLKAHAKANLISMAAKFLDEVRLAPDSKKKSKKKK